ncbi:hypothetical protein CWATWH0402_956 [Crocosphaera watsonii WH 0402]|uniref:Uncharacterized protein n=1 Tax=Crocosphaera watsonii WH 0402 TaxID=1284629 RepID=T2JMS0_CROWT|nr:hypothetical protein CWATWH0402_956 [Crocosphaera watsonii WH 0402]
MKTQVFLNFNFTLCVDNFVRVLLTNKNRDEQPIADLPIQHKSIPIMRQNKDFQPTKELQPCATCADCPMFSDFQDSRNRGWCSAFDKLARTHHPRTNSCEFAIKEYEDQTKIEVGVTLCSHELDIDDDGAIFPKEERIISLFVEEITKKAVYEAFEAHQHDFPGFYILAYHRCYPDAEF